MLENMTREVGAEAMKAAPPIGAVTLTVAGFGLNEWVLLATLAYILLQAAYLLWKWARDWKRAQAPE